MRVLRYLFLVFACFAISSTFAAPAYVSIIDAGSSGSRMHVYRYDDQYAGNIPALNEIYQLRLTPGISSFAGKENQISDVIFPVLAGAKRAIEADGGDTANTPLYLYATAGMRELSDEQQARIYQAINQQIAQFNFQNKGVKTIPGWQEGLFGWLTVNYASGHLQNHQDTIGALDLGGASTQISFETQQDTPDTHHFNLGNESYSVFSHSFLGLGENAAFRDLSKYGDANVCLPRGAPAGDSVGDYQSGECAKLTAKEVGDYDIQTLVPSDAAKHPFVALSGYYYTYDFFNTKTLQGINRNIKGMCNRLDFAAMKQQFPNVPDSYLARYCFDGNLIASLLGNQVGYGFNPRAQNPQVTQSINGYDLDWPLGAAVYLIGNKDANGIDNTELAS